MKPSFSDKPLSASQSVYNNMSQQILSVSSFSEEKCPSHNEQKNLTFSSEHIVNMSSKEPLLSSEESVLLANDDELVPSKDRIDSSTSANVNLSSCASENLNVPSNKNKDCKIDLSSLEHTNFSSMRNIANSGERRSSSPIPSLLQCLSLRRDSLPVSLPFRKETPPSSLRQFLLRDSRNSSNMSLSSEKFNSLDEEWQSVFRKLSKRTEGEERRKIRRGPMLKWAAALDEGTVLSLDLSTPPVTRQKLMRIISEADADKDGYLNEDEFYSLIKEKNAAATPRQQIRLQNYMWVSAYAEKYKLWPPPLVILIISLLQVYFFLHYSYSNLNDQHVPITCSSLIYNPWQRWQIWRYLSYGLLHDGALHLLTNLGVQLLVGLPLEMSHSSGRILLIYLSGVLAGSLGTSLLDPKMFLAGGSGGAYALIAAHLATLILNWEEDQVILGEQLRLREGKIFSASHGRLVSILRLVAVVVFTLVDTGVAVYNRMGGVSTTTGYHAHLAGALAGFTMGVVVLKNRRVKPWQKGLRLACILLFVACVMAGVLWNLFADHLGGGGHFLKADSIIQHECDM